MTRNSDIAQYTPLVKQIARRIIRELPRSVELDDLMQAGLIGLNESLERFASESGATFETYAGRRIRGAMLDQLRADDHLTRDERIRVGQIRKTVSRLEHELGRSPRAAEVAARLEWPLKRLHEALVEAGASPMRSGDDDPDPESDPSLPLERRQREAALSAAFDTLEEAERIVIEWIIQGRPQHELAKDMGLSEGRVSQIASKVVAKLRERLRGV